ncbi:MAG: tryptophan synthase subunit alpha [Armatimonadota bacterium]
MASRLSATFQTLRDKGEKALVVFITGGDPSLEDLPIILETLQEAGADVIEIGLPFSDPIADGPVIQASSFRALTNGATRKGVLRSLREANLDVPVVLMGYYNSMLRPGLANFAQEAVEAGVSGTIVCDIIPEEGLDWIEASRQTGLDTIFLAAPTSTIERLDGVAKYSTGFVYAVSRTGVTGDSTGFGEETNKLISDLKQLTSTPVCVGFGVSQPAHVRALAELADGVVVGSALVRLIAEKWDTSSGRTEVLDYVKSLKEATRG